MRLADALFRSGHLSEQALVDVCMTGERPAHLDRCDICAERALELGRWLDEVRAVAQEDADAAFPQERLAAQQSQILRRLEQVDRPARVIAFPAPSRYDRLDGAPRGIRPAWVAVAAAAGIVLGVFGGQISNRFMADRSNPRPAQTQQPPAQSSGQAQTALALDTATAPFALDEFEHPQIEAVKALDEWTPRTTPAAQVVRTTRTKR